MADPSAGDQKKTIVAIAQLLSLDSIMNLAEQAIGEDPRIAIVGPNDPPAVAIKKILAQLELEGTERWFLTYILIDDAPEKLRSMIVKAWPKTLIGLPAAEDQVASTLKYLQALLSIPLPRNLKFELRSKRDAFNVVRQRIADLHAYKNLHEVLYQLDMKLTFGELVPAADATEPDFSSIVDQCDQILAGAPAFPDLLGPNSDAAKIEQGWIARLQALAAELRISSAGSDLVGCLRTLASIQQLTRLHLSRLNGKVFQAAIGLTFTPLTNDFPEEIEDQTALGDLIHAVRELKPTILARALKHKLWQKAENDMSVLEAFFKIPEGLIADLGHDWFALNKQVIWLADLDRDVPWAKQAKDLAEKIEIDLVNKQVVDDEIRAHFANFRNLFKFGFLAIDNSLKLDCGALRRIDAPLTAIMQELAP
jgi:hypothetical protein